MYNSVIVNNTFNNLDTLYIYGFFCRMPDDHVVVEHFMLNQSLRNMHHLTIDFNGGLGNLMFMYASMYGTARINGLIPLIPDHHYLSSVFPNLWADVVMDVHPGRKWPKFRERNPNMFDRRVFGLNFMMNIELEGFFQSWRYFDSVKKDMKEQMKFTPDIELTCDQYLKKAYNLHLSRFKQREAVFVGIHVRRGDLVDAYNVDRGYTVAPPGYIRKAMDYFSNKYKHVIFIVCSDDKKWTKANVGSFKHQVVFSPYNSAAMDLCLLAKSNHTIMTVGTFGWWGAWLAGGETIYYKDFPARGSQISYGFVPSDYFYPDWIAL